MSISMSISMTVPVETAPSRVHRGGSGAGHIATLDGLRGVAILLVMVYHFGPRVALFPRLLRIVPVTLGLGWCGVDLFFVLSGFLITGILLSAKGSPGYF